MASHHPLPRPATMPCPDQNRIDVFARMLLTERAPLQRYANRLAASAADADDLVQDTVLRCWRARSQFAVGTNFVGWTRTIMRNVFLTGLRRTRHEVELPDDAIERARPVAPAQHVTMDLDDARRALACLPDEQRRAVLMASEGATIDEAVAALAIPANTYKSRVRRGRMRLAQILDGGAPMVPVPPPTPADRPISKMTKQDRLALVIG